MLPNCMMNNERLLKSGRIIFAIGMMGLGIYCLVFQNFIVARPPGWKAPVNMLAAYTSGLLLILSSAAILSNKKTGLAALVMGTLVLIFSVFRNFPNFSPDAVAAYKALAYVGAALIVFISSLPHNAGIQNRLFSNRTFSRWVFIFGYVLLAMFLILCGRAHFKWADGVQYLIPEYIPWRLFWTYFAGVCLYAGGIGLLLPPTRKLAAILSGAMVMGWVVLLHIPRLITNPTDPDIRLEVFEAIAFSGIFFFLAGMADRISDLRFTIREPLNRRSEI